MPKPNNNRPTERMSTVKVLSRALERQIQGLSGSLGGASRGLAERQRKLNEAERRSGSR